MSGYLSADPASVSGMSVDRVRLSVRSDNRTHERDVVSLCPVIPDATGATPYFRIRLFGRLDDPGPVLRAVVAALRDGPDIEALSPGQSVAYTVAGWGFSLSLWGSKELLALFPRGLVERFVTGRDAVGVVITRQPSPVKEKETRHVPR